MSQATIGVPADVDPAAARREAEIAALEAAITAAVVAHLTARLNPITGALTRLHHLADTDPTAWATARLRAARDLRHVRPQAGPVLARLLPRAARLGATHAGGTLPVGHDPRADPLVRDTLHGIDAHATDRLERAALWLTDRPIDTPARLEDALGRVAAVTAGARTDAGQAVARAVSNGVTATADSLGLARMWWTNRGSCLHCASFAGAVAQPGEKFYPVTQYAAKPLPWATDGVDGAPLHPNCIPGDTAVLSSSRVTGATLRVFDGELVTIRTLGDQFLSATPNHPVLTHRGWVPIGGLREGDQVVTKMVGQGPTLVDHNHDDMPTTIEQVAETILRSGKVVAREVPVAPEDFHGDGAGSEVAVVGSDRSLLPPVRDLTGDADLQIRDGREGRLARLGGCLKVLDAGTLPAYRVMRSLGQLRALLGRGLRHPRVHGGAAVAGLDAVSQQVATDRGAGDGIALRDRLLALPGEVRLDDVVAVERNPWSGHVYNLETVEGWYFANAIVTHNCRCHSATHLPDVGAALRREAAREVARGESLYDSLPARLRAVDKILRSSRLPVTVRERARADKARGAFSARTPRALPNRTAGSETKRTG